MRSEQSSITSFFKRAESPRSCSENASSKTETPATVLKRNRGLQGESFDRQEPSLATCEHARSVVSSQEQKEEDRSSQSSTRPSLRASGRRASMQARERLSCLKDEADLKGEADSDDSEHVSQPAKKPRASHDSEVLEKALRGLRYTEGGSAARHPSEEGQKRLTSSKTVKTPAQVRKPLGNHIQSKSRASKREGGNEDEVESIVAHEDMSRSRMLSWKLKSEDQFNQILSDALESAETSEALQRENDKATSSISKSKSSSHAAREPEKVEMSEYEKARLENINRNKSFLMNLGIESLVNTAEEPKAPAKPRRISR